MAPRPAQTPPPAPIAPHRLLPISPPSKAPPTAPPPPSSAGTPASHFTNSAFSQSAPSTRQPPDHLALVAASLSGLHRNPHGDDLGSAVPAQVPAIQPPHSDAVTAVNVDNDTPSTLLPQQQARQASNSGFGVPASQAPSHSLTRTVTALSRSAPPTLTRSTVAGRPPSACGSPAYGSSTPAWPAAPHTSHHLTRPPELAHEAGDR